MQVQARPNIRRIEGTIYADSTKSGGLLLPCLVGQTAAQVRLGYEARHARTGETSFRAVHKSTDATWWAATAGMTSAEFNEAAFAFIVSTH